MPQQRIGTCSICGGDVVGHVGPWWGTQPPPPPRCQSCGAVSAAHDPVIPMRPARPRPVPGGRRTTYEVFEHETIDWGTWLPGPRDVR